MKMCLPILFMGVAAMADSTLKVAAVQFRSGFDVEDNRRRMVSTLAKLSADGVNVAVFPECALTGYSTQTVQADAESIRSAEASIGQACQAHKIAAVFGSVYHVNGKVYDTAVVYDTHGNMAERYAKLHLAGEKWATPGNHIAYFDLEDVPSTVIVCHDERYPELVRLPAMAGARVVYYISHESGMREEKKLPGYRAQMMARAVENGVYVVAANAPGNPDLTGSHGQSRIISTDGNVLQEASFFGDDVLVQTLSIKPKKLATPLQGFMSEWWSNGLQSMMANRGRKLD